MTQSMTPAPTLEDAHELLRYPRDLVRHIEALGPLQIPLRNSDGWHRGVERHLEASGLAGRGGGAFPASTKLALARSGGHGATLIVNGMEGEPASDKDKLLLTRVPHLVLDGAQYLAALCHADRIVICVPLGRNAVAAAVNHAIAERSRHRYAPLREDLVRPPDRFIGGEESALANWMATGSLMPMFRPDKGVPLRIERRPALVHNTETLAHVALIARYGAGPFRSRGMPDAPGTCLVTIGGNVQHPGVVEVDQGTPIWEIATRGQPSGTVQALLVGGYGGKWIGPEHFGVPYAPAPLRAIGATAGVGVIVVLEEGTCGVSESARIAQYLATQGAGQCGPCAYGLPAIADDLALLARGQGGDAGLRRLTRRLDQVAGRGACRHPDGAVGLVRSALAVFAADIAAHVKGAPCPSWRKATSLRFPRPYQF